MENILSRGIEAEQPGITGRYRAGKKVGDKAGVSGVGPEKRACWSPAGVRAAGANRARHPLPCTRRKEEWEKPILLKNVLDEAVKKFNLIKF